MPVDQAKLQSFLGKVVGDIGAAISVPLFIIGEKLGLYKAMAGAGPITAEQLAAKTGCAQRYVREWLMNQAAGGYVQFDAATETFTLPDEQALALADENSSYYMHGGFEIVQSVFMDQEKIADAFRTGKGLHWGEHHECLFRGTERFFRASYAGQLVSSWIPALDGVEPKLKRGARVADIGCGHGASTIIMAEAYPNSTFVGLDYHDKSIAAAKRAAAERGNPRNVSFHTASASDFAGDGFDLVACFDCLHDMADPVGAAKHIHGVLKSDGAWMIVEPFASDKPEENLNPIGRVYFGASTTVCIPTSLAGNGPALGAQAGESRIRDVVERGGFARFRRAAQTPFNLIFEARR